MAIMSYICRSTTSINYISICIHIIETVALTCHAANMQATVLQHIKHPVKARHIANNARRSQIHNSTAKSAYTFANFRTAIWHISSKRGCANHILQCRSLDYRQWGISKSVLGRLYGDSITVIGFRHASICGWSTCLNTSSTCSSCLSCR